MALIKKELAGIENVRNKAVEIGNHKGQKIAWKDLLMDEETGWQISLTFLPSERTFFSLNVKEPIEKSFCFSLITVFRARED